MFNNEPIEVWIERYEQSHQNEFNRICHTAGIPLIGASVPFFFLMLALRQSVRVPLAMFLFGWVLQFVGHAVEGKPPEFLRDWRFFFVGGRWWVAKVTGKLNHTSAPEA